MQQRRFPRTRLAREGHDFAGAHHKREIFENLKALFARTKNAGDAAQFKGGL